MAIVLCPAGGGLGNLLFQHNTVYALGKKYNCPIFIYIDYPDSRPNIFAYKTLFNHIQFINNNGLLQLSSNKTTIRYKDPAFIFNDILLTIDYNTVIIINGYFQSYKYFEPYISDIGDLLKKNETELYNKMQFKYNNIKKHGKSDFETVCCHIRRGDYLTSGTYYNILDDSYYKKGLEYFKDIHKYKILIFAENINEIRNWNIWENYNIHYIDDEPDPLPTLFLMSLCDHFIIANSSLSTNAYYINCNFGNDEQKIIAPLQWFGISGPECNINDIIPNKSILI
jgi:hypothetical protein